MKILLAGPGTGKTTNIKTINNCSVLILTPVEFVVLPLIEKLTQDGVDFSSNKKICDKTHFYFGTTKKFC